MDRTDEPINRNELVYSILFVVSSERSHSRSSWFCSNEPSTFHIYNYSYRCIFFKKCTANSWKSVEIEKMNFRLEWISKCAVRVQRVHLLHNLHDDVDDNDDAIRNCLRFITQFTIKSTNRRVPAHTKQNEKIRSNLRICSFFILFGCFRCSLLLLTLFRLYERHSPSLPPSTSFHKSLLFENLRAESTFLTSPSSMSSMERQSRNIARGTYAFVSNTFLFQLHFLCLLLLLLEYAREFGMALPFPLPKNHYTFCVAVAVCIEGGGMGRCAVLWQWRSSAFVFYRFVVFFLFFLVFLLFFFSGFVSFVCCNCC